MRRRSRIVIGLNSGTSADGVDAVACEISGRGLKMRVKLLGHGHSPYPPTLRTRLLGAMAPAATHTEEICKLEVEVGRAFAKSGAAIVKKLRLKRVDLAGSHGQTICHLPPGRESRGRESVAGTMQIGDASIISATLKCPVVHGFRQADMAVGGQGAPLVPWTDYVLFGHAKKNRVLQNIGGIANLTWLPAGGRLEATAAFDTGPGNMVIDALVRHFTHGREYYDRGGKKAALGEVDLRLSEEMFTHKFIRHLPPKSCGREEFGEPWVRSLLRKHGGRGLRDCDWIMTATDFTASTILFAITLLLPKHRGRSQKLDELILCGGGALNSTLRKLLQSSFLRCESTQNVRITTTADYGIPIQAKESVSFAMLAAARADGVPANLPQVTGASRGVALGSICSLEATQ